MACELKKKLKNLLKPSIELKTKNIKKMTKCELLNLQNFNTPTVIKKKLQKDSLFELKIFGIKFQT